MTHDEQRKAYTEVFSALFAGVFYRLVGWPVIEIYEDGAAEPAHYVLEHPVLKRFVDAQGLTSLRDVARDLGIRHPVARRLTPKEVRAVFADVPPLPGPEARVQAFIRADPVLSSFLPLRISQEV